MQEQEDRKMSQSETRKADHPEGSGSEFGDSETGAENNKVVSTV